MSVFLGILFVGALIFGGVLIAFLLFSIWLADDDYRRDVQKDLAIGIVICAAILTAVGLLGS